MQGGVRVPAFAVDMSGGKYLGQMGRRFEGMVHIRHKLLQADFASMFNCSTINIEYLLSTLNSATVM